MNLNNKNHELYVILFEEDNDQNKFAPLLRKGEGSHSDVIVWDTRARAEAVASELLANGDRVKVAELTIPSLESWCARISSGTQHVGYRIAPSE